MSSLRRVGDFARELPALLEGDVTPGRVQCYPGKGETFTGSLVSGSKLLGSHRNQESKSIKHNSQGAQRADPAPTCCAPHPRLARRQWPRGMCKTLVLCIGKGLGAPASPQPKDPRSSAFTEVLGWPPSTQHTLGGGWPCFPWSLCVLSPVNARTCWLPLKNHQTQVWSQAMHSRPSAVAR